MVIGYFLWSICRRWGKGIFVLSMDFYCGPPQLAREHCSFYFLFLLFSNHLTLASNTSNENMQKALIAS